MSDIHINIRSTWAGVRTMKLKQRPRHPKSYAKSRSMSAQGIEHGARWFIDFKKLGYWCHSWTPTWHNGRGPYISIGLGFCRIVRGY